MKKNILRISSLIVLAAMLFSFAACGTGDAANGNIVQISMIYDPNSPYAPGNGGSGSVNGNTISNNGNQGGSSAQTPNSGDAQQNPNGGDTQQTPNSGDAQQKPNGGDAQQNPNGGNASASNLPSTPDDIMAKYKELTHNMKANIKSYNKKEFQDVQNLDLGMASSVVNGLLPQFLTTEEKAEVQAKGAEPGSIPPWSDTEGCLFDNGSFVKSAKCTDKGDGTAEMVIVLKDENNPEPASNGASPSETGKMFSPLKKADIDNTLAGISVIKVEKFDLLYRDCTATIIYDTASGQIKSMTQVMNIDVTATVKLGLTINGSGTVINTIQITDIKY